MNIKDLIKDKTCYIVSSDLKKEILSYLSEKKLILDIHFFSLSQIIERLYFKYDTRAIYFVSKEYDLSYSNAKVIIESIKFLIYSNKISDEKYFYLENIKNYLDQNNLLEYENDFLNYLNKYNIMCDLNPGNELLYKINKLLNNKIEFLKNEVAETNNIYEFNNSEEEIEYLANNISNLLTKGIEPHKIHILNYNDAYYSYIDKIFTLYNIPYHLNNDNNLYDLPYIKRIYNNYIANEGFIENDGNNDIFNQFVSIANSLNFIKEFNDKADFLLFILKNKKVNHNLYKNCVCFSNFEGTYIDDHYYFFIGLNNKVFPIYKKDEDYISDKLKNDLGYLTSYKINELTRNYCLNRLLYNKNIVISYRNSDFFNAYLKSDLVDKITNKVIKETNINNYSKQYDYLKLTRNLDDFYKYNQKSEELLNLLSKLDKKDYRSYSNSYNNIDSNYYLENICKNKISISYSSFERFNECHYKYYLNSILKQNEDSFTTYIGNLFHHVLEQIYDIDFNFENAINSFSSDYQLSDKERILLGNLMEDFKEKINIVLTQYDKGNYKKIKKEERIAINIKSKVSISINGIIDKLLLDENNHGYIVDYKTGNTKLTLEYIKEGIRCQLPFYFYLLNKSKEYADIFLVGCYLQLINFRIKSHNENSKEMQLEGLTYNDASIIEGIDNEYSIDSFIKGIKPNKKGLGTYAKVFNDEDFNNIIETMEFNINKMIDDIVNVRFDISPKILKKKETTCRYCNYSDICYKTFKDYIDIRKDNADEMDE